MISMPHWPLYLGASKDTTNPLSRVMSILQQLGNPEKKIHNVIHITGTNGKGSTASYVRNILEEYGYSVNCYTSPHIYEANERIIIKGSKITDRYLYDLTEDLRILTNNREDITIFEAATIIAFIAFAENIADFNVIEVGMGGRVDATNVFDHSIACVFTPIHLDHTKFLGPDIESIATEKSYILKRKANCIIGPQTLSALSIIKNHAQKLNCRVSCYDNDFHVEKIEDYDKLMSINLHGREIIVKRPSLLGDHQLINASVAIATLNSVGIEIDVDKINAGLSKTYWPMRLEKVKNNELLKLLPSSSKLYMDGAHNVSGAHVISNWLREEKEKDPDLENFIIIGRTKGTDSSDFMKQFIGVAFSAFSVRVKREALPEAPEVIAEQSKKGGFLSIIPVSNLEEAILHIKEYKNPARVVICGSLYLGRDVRAYAL